MESTCSYYNADYKPNTDKWVFKADGTMKAFYLDQNNEWKEGEDTQDKVIKWSVSNNILTIIDGDKVSKVDCKVTNTNFYIYSKSINFAEEKIYYFYQQQIPEGLSALKTLREVRVYTKQ